MKPLVYRQCRHVPKALLVLNTLRLLQAVQFQRPSGCSWTRGGADKVGAL